MWKRTAAAMLLALPFGVMALPATAREPGQARGLTSSQLVMAFLAEHGVTGQTLRGPQLAACKEEGAQCSTNADCCSGECRHIDEDGYNCVTK